MELPIFQVDAFTSAVFAGNPAAICPLESWLPDATMQAIASENNLAETAFFVPEAGRGRFHLRWFTPVCEVDLCGHATLASAYVLFNELNEPGETVRFETKSGELTVRRVGGRLVMDFPSRPPGKIDPDPALLSGARRQASRSSCRAGLSCALRRRGERPGAFAQHGSTSAHRSLRRDRDSPGYRLRLCLAVLCSRERRSGRSGHGFRSLHVDSLLGEGAREDHLARAPDFAAWWRGLLQTGRRPRGNRWIRCSLSEGADSGLRLCQKSEYPSARWIARTLVRWWSRSMPQAAPRS